MDGSFLIDSSYRTHGQNLQCPIRFPAWLFVGDTVAPFVWTRRCGVLLLAQKYGNCCGTSTLLDCICQTFYGSAHRIRGVGLTGQMRRFCHTKNTPYRPFHSTTILDSSSGVAVSIPCSLHSSTMREISLDICAVSYVDDPA